ncbi:MULTISPECIES: alpha/beta hydrolase [unclassified Isoptericola]|uniref:alpha/beta hydrolase n=1 Tax=unclassified Isoptericola TaxID=2623355 RepID=UPI002713FE85|nr:MULTISPECIES: alpha/beta hydrolase [unclassified Isoptericola]MDO8143344.1 alpha/beta hydrolase [Isoptericola sp. 178]MDO8147207.1 alpha/beta hydrolase [Isoptericola sp. b515]
MKFPARHPRPYPDVPAGRRTGVLAGVTAAALALAGCTADAPAKTATPVGEATVEAGSDPVAGGPEGFEDFYAQDLEWSGCRGGFECATATAPLSWDDPEAGSIELELVRTRATGEKVGSLLVNPGGPGGSGTDFVENGSFGEPLRESFDIVGFDPRGVQDSTAVTCFDDAKKDEYLSEDYDLTTDAGLEDARESAAAWAEACEQNTGELLGEVDTQSAAKDMDLLRAVLGDDQLHYLGFSYGTSLGATYAGLFPDRVGRLVLDGAIDPTLDADEISAGQAVGFENALRAYVTDCQAGADCPLTGSVDEGMQQVRDVLDRAYDNPYPTSGDRDVTQTLAFYGVAVTLYAEQSWPVLTQALDEAINAGTGDTLLYLADFYNDRNADGSFATNSTEAFTAINCLDSAGATDVETMRAEAKEIEEAAPTMGSFFGYGGLSCADWPYPPAEQEYDVAAPGADPIVVIGTTNDPATPYVWSEGMADALDSGVLVTYEGEGHTAYGRSNDCIADAVENYLIEGTVPEDGLTC